MKIKIKLVIIKKFSTLISINWITLYDSKTCFRKNRIVFEINIKNFNIKNFLVYGISFNENLLHLQERKYDKHKS